MTCVQKSVHVVALRRRQARPSCSQEGVSKRGRCGNTDKAACRRREMAICLSREMWAGRWLSRASCESGTEQWMLQRSHLGAPATVYGGVMGFRGRKEASLMACSGAAVRYEARNLADPNRRPRCTSETVAGDVSECRAFTERVHG